MSDSVNVISDKMLALVHDATRAAYDFAIAIELRHNVKAAMLADERSLRALAEAIAELEAENARLKAEQADPKVEYNLKAKSSIGFCSEHAADLINKLGRAAWYYGRSCSFENYTAQIEADAALCDFVARLERREKDFNELVEIVLEVSRYHANMWNEKALLAWRALEKFLNKERQ